MRARKPLLASVIVALAVVGQVAVSGAQVDAPQEETPESTTTTVPSTTVPSTTATTSAPSTTAPSSTTTTTVLDAPLEALATVSGNEAPEFATDTWSDPWDMSNRDDIMIHDQPWTAQNLIGPAFSSGKLSFRLNGNCGASSCIGFISPLWNGMFPDALAAGRDGIIGGFAGNGINAGVYNSLSIRMKVSGGLKPSGHGVFWTRGKSANDASQRGGMATPYVGDGQWHTYTFRLLGDSALGSVPFSGTINGLRIAMQPAIGQTPLVEIDWIRLFQAGASPSAAGIAPLDTGLASYTGTGVAACEQILGRAGKSNLADLSMLPDGTYQVFSNADCSPGGTVTNATIAVRPRPQVVEPDITGGTDYATNFLKDPWDFSNAKDVARTGNLCGGTFTRWAGTYSAYNCRVPYTGYIDDPFVQLRVGSGPYAIPTYKYHRITVKFTFEGPFSLYGGCRGGTIGRVLWLDSNYRSGPARQTRPFVTYKDRDTITVDLNLPAHALNDGASSSWAPFVLPKGKYVTYLRWDPNEDTCARWFHLDDVKLRADDAPVFNQFQIKWSDATAQPGDSVDLVSAGPNGVTVLATGLPNSANGSFTWNMTGLPKGSYQVLVRVNRNGQFADSWATGPVTIL
jgi:hypothetical protein